MSAEQNLEVNSNATAVPELGNPTATQLERLLGRDEFVVSGMQEIFLKITKCKRPTNDDRVTVTITVLIKKNGKEQEKRVFDAVKITNGAADHATRIAEKNEELLGLLSVKANWDE